MAESPILTLENVSKSFPGVRALDQVSLNVLPGKVMALLGENGAGKSTLMKVMTGVYQPDEGTMVYAGNTGWFRSPRLSQEAGIAIIHQELNLFPELTIGENIFLGREPTNWLGKIKWSELYENSAKLLERLGVKHHPRTAVKEISIADQQMVEIAKALAFEAKVIIMDEPTDALTDPETKALFRVVEDLRKAGCGIVYISHRLPEIFQICDHVTVLRDGQFISESRLEDIDENGLVEQMVGRKLEEQYPYIKTDIGPIVLDVKGLTGSRFQDISFEVHAGEVLAFSGLIGAGRSEVMKAIFGAYGKYSGEVKMHDRPLKLRSPSEAYRAGIAYITEDRKGDGLVMSMSVKENMTLASLRAFSSGPQLQHRLERERATEHIKSLRIKTPNMDQEIGNLSGGNQQKALLAKGLMTQPEVLILDEPTRGVDVGAKKEIYQLINSLKQQGIAIILVSSDMPEVLGISDRIMIMHKGRINAEMSREQATQEQIMIHALGTNTDEVAS
jgi:ribose transport system ATP-binding protein